MIDEKLKVFVNPKTKQVLEKDPEGNLFCMEGDRRATYKCYSGCYDFVVSDKNLTESRQVYDKFYAREDPSRLTLAEVTEAWRDATVPWRETMLESLGSMSGRRVLLLGNGESYKEFYFLHLGAQVVFTDLSLVAVQRAQSVFRRSELCRMHGERIEFHAVDAMHLPFPDQAFDVIYGSKFVGFLGNLQAFFSEVGRCLKPGGKCRFTDDAHSPAWEAVRRTLVHPVKRRLLRKSRASLANVRFASTFGFKEESLAPYVEPCGFDRLVFIREYFFLRIAQLCWGTVVRWNPEGLRYARPFYLAMKWIDKRMVNNSWMRRNQLGLTWGFDKQVGISGAAAGLKVSCLSNSTGPITRPKTTLDGARA